MNAILLVIPKHLHFETFSHDLLAIIKL